MRGNKKTVFAIAALAVVAALMLGLWYFNRPQIQAGDKTIVVEVVHGDKSAKEFTYYTDAEMLGDVLAAEKLVEGEDTAFGLFIKTADGETVQGRDWWCVTKGGERLETGVDTTPIADGDHFELTLTAGGG